MRKILTIIAMAILLSACQKPYEKAVENYVKESFNDPNSYECVELGKPQECTVVLYAMEQVRAKGEAEGWTPDSIFNKTMELRPYLIEHGDDPDAVLFRYISHTYRANNAMGAKVLRKEKWYLNDDLTKVIRTEPE